MNLAPCLDSTAFAGLLKTSFVAHSVPHPSNIDSAVEQIKCKAALLALTIFDPGGKKDVVFSSDVKFSHIFSQDTYGAGFTKGLSIILAYLICLDETPMEGRSEAVNKFADKVQGIASSIFTRISSGDSKLFDVRKQAEQLDNHGGYYNRTSLSITTAQKLTSDGLLQCSLEMDPYSGHLIAKLASDLSKQLLEAYRPEIETYLTEAGKNNLELPYNIGCVVVAYKDELASIPKKILENLLQSGRKIDLSFKEPYVVPVRGDNRYSLVASILMESADITSIRKELGLGELYSEGRPLRFTFGAVHNPHIPCENASLVDRMKNSHSLEKWMHFISAKAV